MAETPVDISQLAGILGKSKSLLDKVDQTFGKSGSGGDYSKEPTSINEGSTPPLPSGMVDSSQMLTSLPPGKGGSVSSDPTQPIRRTLKNAKTTRMPKEIVEAMINNPVADPASVGSVEGMDPELIKMINPNYNKEPKKVIKESLPKNNTQNNTSGDLKSLIREVVEEIIVERKVDEQLQIRVGDTIFTGKITKSKSINK
jgi:hypothetical protein